MLCARRSSIPSRAFFAVAIVVAVGGCGDCGGPIVDDVDGCKGVDACGENEVCAGGDCVASPECLAIDDWPFCREALNELQTGLGQTAICQSDGEDTLSFHCSVACQVDDDCAEGRLCTDFGRCVDGLKRETPGAVPGTHAPLLAGVGEVRLDVPLTVSLGGLSSRAGPGDGRWADGMDAAVGTLEGLWARAASLDVGDGRLLVVRLPIIFPTGAMTEAIAARINALTGDDYRDALVVSGTHTHSGPARFLPLLGESEAVLGPFGIGTFRQEVFDRLVESSAAAAVAAIEAQAPARVGWTIVEAFDVDDAIARDRRDESPDFDDNRALVIRVDDDAGIPLFVLTGFGVHPTDNGSNWATNEICGGVERHLEDALFPIANRVVPVLFINGAGGSMAPAAGGRGFDVPHGNDYTGAVYAERVLPALLDIETKADVTLNARNHRFFVNNTILGYAPGEWVNPGQPPFGGEVSYGGLNCFRGDYDDGDVPFSGHIDRADMACGISFHTFLFNHPPSVFQRTSISAIELDGLAMLSMPGELTMEMGWGIAAELQRSHGVDPMAFFGIGYGNDHLMYLLPTTLDEDAPPWPGYTGVAPRSLPPFAFSPLRGGFEADTSIFGDRLGDLVVRESVVAWDRLQTRAPSSLEPAPPVYSTDVKPEIEVDATNNDRAGFILTALPAVVARRTPVPLSFIGGDVALEGQGPIVSLVRDDGTPVLQPSGRPLSTEHALFALHAARESNEWRWTATLELPVDLPSGDYKLHVEGVRSDAGAKVPYTFDTEAFAVAPAPIVVSAVRDGADLVVRAGFSTDRPTLENERVTGRLRLVDHRVPSGQLAPVAGVVAAGVVVSVDGADIVADSVAEEVIDGVPATVARVVGVGAGAAEVTVTDAVGNVGTVSVPAAE
jgi:hypothetical protein